MALERSVIIAAALDLLDEVGLEGLTMRKLAEKLGVQAPSIYWHFSGKPALLDDMADAMLADMPTHFRTDAGPDEVLRLTAERMREALLARREGARVYAGTFVARDNIFRVADATMQALAKVDVQGTLAANAVFTVFYFVLGFVIEEQARQSLTEERSKELQQQSERLPATKALLSGLIAFDDDRRFQAGLDLILSGWTSAR